MHASSFFCIRKHSKCFSQHISNPLSTYFFACSHNAKNSIFLIIDLSYKIKGNHDPSGSVLVTFFSFLGRCSPVQVVSCRSPVSYISPQSSNSYASHECIANVPSPTQRSQKIAAQSEQLIILSPRLISVPHSAQAHPANTAGVIIESISANVTIISNLFL